MNEYWMIIENRTGRVICYCGNISDAMMMVLLDPHNRSYKKQKFIVDQVIDVQFTTDKQLPGQYGLPSGKIEQLNPVREKLPEGVQEPVIL